MTIEVIALIVFCVFATLILREPLQFRYLISFALFIKYGLFHVQKVINCPGQANAVFWFSVSLSDLILLCAHRHCPVSQAQNSE